MIETKLQIYPSTLNGTENLELKHKGLRFNKGKLRYDLVNPYAHEQMVKILTIGSNKYSERNWEAGMAWSNVISSLKRHLAAIEAGEDYDKESGELHAAHVACNAHFLTAYYKLYPQGDDRPHKYLNQPRIGLDIDEVICNWVEAWCKKYKQPIPTSWNFEWDTQEKFKLLRESGELDIFYGGLEPRISPEEIPFEPTCYISHRPVDKEVTENWLKRHGFPLKPVYIVSKREDKLTVARKENLDIFVDDNYDTFVYMNKNGICTFLMDAPHNKRYDVGARRIKSLKELV